MFARLNKKSILLFLFPRFYCFTIMKPDEKTLTQFKQLYKDEFGDELTDQEAFDRFSRLVNALRIIYYSD